MSAVINVEDGINVTQSINSAQPIACEPSGDPELENS